ncbi:MAG: hypothetical protein KDG50_05235 [Chromatiales bacterium]|nr:hypothetical protein [Chromatiales bacterium]
MIRAFSQRLMPPFSGQVQIAQSDKYRAITLDGQIWEIQYVKRSHVRVATVSSSDIQSHRVRDELRDGGSADEQLIELLDDLASIRLPFPAADLYEYWLLDAADESPLALVFSCAEAEQMDKFPARAEWTALPAAVMPIAQTDEEKRNQAPPVNYRFERLVAERAGTRPKARWFKRGADGHDSNPFPPLMVREDWPEASDRDLCRRYIERQSPRLLMLHGLDLDDRRRLERSCRPHAMEVARFCMLYPEIVDRDLIEALRVEAKLRIAAGAEDRPAVHNRRDGILYI